MEHNDRIEEMLEWNDRYSKWAGETIKEQQATIAALVDALKMVKSKVEVVWMEDEWEQILQALALVEGDE